jgi:hypothetical protein
MALGNGLFEIGWIVDSKLARGGRSLSCGYICSPAKTPADRDARRAHLAQHDLYGAAIGQGVVLATDRSTHSAIKAGT